MPAASTESLTLVLVCFSRAKGALELKLVELASALQHRGNRVVVVSPHESAIASLCAQRGVPGVNISPSMPYLDLAAGWRLGRCLRAHGVDVVVAGRSKDISICLLGRTLAGRPRLVYLQQVQAGRRKDPFHNWVYGSLDRWVTLTEGMKRSVIAGTTVPADRIAVIPFGVDLDRFNPTVHRGPEDRCRLGIPPERFVVAVIARLDPLKGQAVLIRAFSELLPRHPSLHLLIVGDGGGPECRESLESLVAELGIGERVQFLPFTGNVPEVLAAVDLLVLPSLREAFGNVIVEAMAMAKPVIASRTGGVPEIIEEGRTGLMVTPSDAADLARKLEMMVQDAGLRIRLAEAGRKLALERYDYRAQVGEFLSLLRDVVAVRPGAFVTARPESPRPSTSLSHRLSRIAGHALRNR